MTKTAINRNDDLDPDPLTILTAISSALGALATVYQCYQADVNLKGERSSPNVYAKDTVYQLEQSLFHIQRVSERLLGLFTRAATRVEEPRDKISASVRFGIIHRGFSESDSRHLQDLLGQLFQYCGSVAALSIQLGRIVAQEDININEGTLRELQDLP